MYIYIYIYIIYRYYISRYIYMYNYISLVFCSKKLLSFKEIIISSFLGGTDQI